MEFPRLTAVALVEDDEDFRNALNERLSLEGFEVQAFRTADLALKAVTAEFPGVVVTDLRMPGMDGRQLLTRLQALDPALPVILITGHGDIAEAVAAMRDGAYDFVAKPFAFDRLHDSLKRAMEKRALVLDNRRLAALSSEAGVELPLLGESRAIRSLRATIAQIADARMDVLIEGETGVGKELVARGIHRQSARKDKPMVVINCAALPDALVESELFGHVRGAFTGAVGERRGKFELADGGTLFLDEVGELPLASQAKLLRVLQSGQLQRVGSDREHQVDVRVIAATNLDLADAVRQGRFRADLYHRLGAYPLRVPPLRERERDVLLLAGFFIEEARSRMGLRSLRLSADAQAALLGYDWPGNVRELEHLIGRAVLRALAASGTVRPRILTVDAAALELPVHSDASVQAPAGAGETLQAEDLRKAVGDFQRQRIAATLERTAGNWTESARLLGLDRANLNRLAKRLGLK